MYTGEHFLPLDIMWNFSCPQLIVHRILHHGVQFVSMLQMHSIIKWGKWITFKHYNATQEIFIQYVILKTVFLTYNIFLRLLFLYYQVNYFSSHYLWKKSQVNINTLWQILFLSVNLIKVAADRFHWEEIKKAYNERIGSLQESSVLAGYFGRHKHGAVVVVRWYFPQSFKWVIEIIKKNCDACQHMNTTKLQEGQENLHPIPVPLKVWTQTGFDLPGPLKGNDAYKYIVTAVNFTNEFVEAKPIKTGEAVDKFLYKLQCCNGSYEVHITDQCTELMNNISE